MAQDRVLVEAESFDDKGGWQVDQQFVHLMGSPYLIAHGLGKPVANAETIVRFPAAGTYRVWVRTKDWVPGPWDAPGRFQVAVGGEKIDAIFGTREGWGWEDGGSIDVAGGETTVELCDMAGFDGRCDALFFTTDSTFVPPNDRIELAAWRNQLQGMPGTPPSAGRFDLVIVGGGIAGCAAALAADRQGLVVALIHDRPVLGGNASGEIRVHTEGIHGEGGDILSQIDTVHWPNGSADALKDDRKRQRAMDATENVTFFLEWRAYGVTTEDSRITAVNAKHIETGQVMSVTAPVYIDSTGDGWIGFWAGAEFRYGRESREEFGESWDKHGELWSPEEADNRVMGASLLWYSRETEAPVSFPDVPWAMDVAKSHAATKGEWYWEYSSNDKHAIHDAEDIRDHMLRAIYGSFANAKKEAKHARRALDWVGYLSGKRESRRLVGDYIYTMKDAVEERYFPDTVVSETRDIDVHYQRILAAKKEQETPDFLSHALFYRVGRYHIPFRCLYSRNIENLMMAGRCFSCSHIGLGGPRVMLTCGQMGIATGFAASLCTKHGVLPRGVYEKHIDELRELVGQAEPEEEALDGLARTSHGKYRMEELPETLASLPRITVRRGHSGSPAPAYTVRVNADVTVYLAVHERGTCTLSPDWKKTNMTIRWDPAHRDAVYTRDFPAGTVEIPAHDGKDGAYFGLPHVAFIDGKESAAKLKIEGLPIEHGGRLYVPVPPDGSE